MKIFNHFRLLIFLLFKPDIHHSSLSNSLPRFKSLNYSFIQLQIFCNHNKDKKNSHISSITSVFLNSYRMEIKVFSGIMVAHIRDNLSEPFHIIRQLTVGNIISDQIAKDSTEIFMPGE